MTTKIMREGGDSVEAIASRTAATVREATREVLDDEACPDCFIAGSLSGFHKQYDGLVTSHNELLAALKAAVETIRVWHSIHDADDTAWDIYRQHAPEMKSLFAAIARAEGR